jgi:hypothetical protein
MQGGVFGAVADSSAFLEAIQGRKSPLTVGASS